MNIIQLDDIRGKNGLLLICQALQLSQTQTLEKLLTHFTFWWAARLNMKIYMWQYFTTYNETFLCFCHFSWIDHTTVDFAHAPTTVIKLWYHCVWSYRYIFSQFFNQTWTSIVQLAQDCLLPWWRHQMETFSALLALCTGNSPVPVNSPHKGQWQ